ncbi:putative mitochondrial protein [Cucumis melo var. makuwa]|uniref:Mitochondrial protein n=1 Tax=Cucumis melo var. makuwa TaxID=1194695 RepID=A0A5A7SYK8_CUCMM|nr:putative mitochondrial protein [Cucumis melo var. makuwa]
MLRFRPTPASDTDSAAFSAQSSNHANDKNNGKPILICEYCKKQWHTQDRTPTLDVITQSEESLDLRLWGYKSLDRRNLIREVWSPTSQSPTPVQEFKPPRDQGIENPTEPCTNNKMNENHKSAVAILENVEEKNSGDETDVRAETSNNEAEQDHTKKLDEYDPSLNILIALIKEIFSSVANLNSVRILLSVAMNKDCALYQMNVKNSSLNGDLVEEVYMSSPPGFEA